MLVNHKFSSQSSYFYLTFELCYLELPSGISDESPLLAGAPFSFLFIRLHHHVSLSNMSSHCYNWRVNDWQRPFTAYCRV
jgi:hypothetical protein